MLRGAGPQAQRWLREIHHHFLPFVTMKVAATLDGRIAPAQQSARGHFWITGERSSRRSASHAPRRRCTDCRRGHDPRRRSFADRSQSTCRGGGRCCASCSTQRCALRWTHNWSRPRTRMCLYFSARRPCHTKGARSARRTPAADLRIAGPRIPLQEALVRLAEMQITNLLLEGGAEVYTCPQAGPGG